MINPIKYIADSISNLCDSIALVFNENTTTLETSDEIKNLIEINGLYESIDDFCDMLQKFKIINIFFDHEPFKLSNNKLLQKLNTTTKTFTIVDENKKSTKVKHLNINDVELFIKEIDRLDVFWKIDKETFTMFRGRVYNDDTHYKVYGDKETSLLDYYLIKKWKFK